MPNFAGNGGEWLSSVSCGDASSCTAVGYWYDQASATVEAFVQTWNGSSWSVGSLPMSAGTTYAVLTGVSCSAPDACTAVGYYDGSGSASAGLPLVEVWDGTGWTLQNIPNAADNSELYGVSCTAPEVCTAVGSLIEASSGSTWTLQEGPNGSSSSNLFDVSCASATNCVAVGASYDGQQQNATSESWNGTAWGLDPVPSPAGGSTSLLYGVSCTASSCTAVGVAYNSLGLEVALAEAGSV